METEQLKTIPDFLYFRYRNHPDREAYVFAHTDGSRTVVTFKQLYENANILAKSLVKLGVMKSEFIANNLRSCPEWLYVTFGAMLAGARPISLVFTYTDGSDVIAMMKKLETCSMIVLDPSEDVDTWKIFQKLVSKYDEMGNVESKSLPYLKYLICRNKLTEDGEVLTIKELLNRKSDDVTLPTLYPDDIITLFQTSGSTGAPKAVAHTNRSIIGCFDGFLTPYTEEERSITFNDRPFSWIGGYPLNVVTGETRVTRFGYSEQPTDLIGFLIDVIQRERCTFLIALPPLLNSFMERQDRISPGWPVMVVGSGGQPMSKNVLNCVGKLCKKFGTGYGATEFLIGTGMTVDDPGDFQEYSIGYPYPGMQIRVCDDNGEPVPTNQRGELHVKSDGMFLGYYNDQGKTKAAFSEDGWFKTDDIGFVTEEGLFFCEGRKSEMIISGGMNVAPTILEAALRNCPGVARVICVPVAHDVMYQVICACVILEDGAEVTEDQLRQYCEDVHNDKPRLFTVLPTYYIFLTEFPETYTGKVSRKDLTRVACEKFLSV